jgi:hypothetical protein
MKVDMSMEDALMLQATLLAEIEKNERRLDEVGLMTDYVRAQVMEDTQFLSDLLERFDTAIEGEYFHQKNKVVALHTDTMQHRGGIVHYGS